MGIQTAFVGIGSNIEPRRHILRAMQQLALLSESPVLLSPFYRTEPWGDEDQPSFVNAVAGIRTSLRPERLLAQLHCIERRARRVRSERRFGPRTLDLDLLAVDQFVRNSPQLILPHPRLSERRFVLKPWARLAPRFRVVGQGSVMTLLNRCDDPLTVQPLRRLDNSTL